MKDKKREQEECAHCHRKVGLGEDTLQVQPGVIGHRGFIPLDDAETLCSTSCLAKHYGHHEAPPRKLP